MSVVRSVRDIELHDRQALERFLGRSLHDDEQVVVEVVRPSSHLAPEETRAGRSLPEWCDVYAGLSDGEVDEIETAIERSYGSRLIE